MSLQSIEEISSILWGSSHNPCFSRNVFAIKVLEAEAEAEALSQSLF